MAESLVSQLASRGFEEASIALGVYDDLQRLKETLSITKGVISGAKDEAWREWLKQIKDVSTDAENVLDEFECEALRKQVVEQHGSTKKKVCHFLSSSNPLVFHLRVAHKIKEIRKRLDKVAADGAKFGLERINVNRSVENRRDTYSHVIASDVIGRDHDKEKIIDLLIKPSPHDDANMSLSVIPIVGIGGMGKTTLAKLVFNDGRMDKRFPLKMWVCVSDEFDIKHILIKMISCAPGSAGEVNLKESDMEQLKDHLKKKLSGQKFLLVLDDLWNENYVKWVELRDLLKVSAKEGKIVVTTQSQDIAEMVGTIPTYMLYGLTPEDSVRMFVKWAFKEGDEKKYPNLVKIGKEIVSKCKGVPLAVRTLASSLLLKVDEEEWRFVRDNELWNLKQKETDILPALKLSYDRMPFYLKRCFALFSLYPKDFEFKSIYVVELWRALGLLQLSDGFSKLEDVGKQYLSELHSRCFLQEFTYFGYFYSFKMHGLVHDLALYVAQDECLMVNSHTRNISEKVQHLSIIEEGDGDEQSTGKKLRCCVQNLAKMVKKELPSSTSFPESNSVRTIIFPIERVGANSKALLNLWLSKYKYLRVLDLSDSSFESLPNSIGKLRHLRYFDLSYNYMIKRIPNSICELQSLQTLSLKKCVSLEALPKGLRNMISLRQLWISTTQSVLPEEDIASLTALETLSFEFCYNLGSMFKGIDQLTSLKRLEFHDCWTLKSLLFSMKHLPELVALSIVRCEDLELSEGHDDPAIAGPKLASVLLESMPKLVALPQWLQGSANTLHTLIIAFCENLVVLPDWLATSAHLNTMRILHCPKLLSLPNGMNGFTGLEVLEIAACPKLIGKCQYQVGGYWPHISHIKTIIVRDG